MQRYRYTWFLMSLIAMIILAPITERGAIADLAHQISVHEHRFARAERGDAATRSP